MSERRALVVIDFINEIIHPEGKFKGKGYAAFAQEHNTLDNTRKAIETAKAKNYLVVLVRVGFHSSYFDQPKHSLLFGKAHEFGALTLDTWATEFHEDLPIDQADFVVIKHRISAFHQTPLDLYLKANKVTDVYLSGVATDLAVESAARDAHDLDYSVFVVKDCCAAGAESDHNNSLATLSKISTVISSDDL